MGTLKSFSFQTWLIQNLKMWKICSIHVWFKIWKCTIKQKNNFWIYTFIMYNVMAMDLHQTLYIWQFCFDQAEKQTECQPPGHRRSWYLIKNIVINNLGILFFYLPTLVYKITPMCFISKCSNLNRSSAFGSVGAVGCHGSARGAVNGALLVCGFEPPAMRPSP